MFFSELVSKVLFIFLRICIVDADLNVLYSTFVKPKNPITHYLTQFSGITAEMLEGVTTTLRSVIINIAIITA